MPLNRRPFVDRAMVCVFPNIHGALARADQVGPYLFFSGEEKVDSGTCVIRFCEGVVLDRRPVKVLKFSPKICHSSLICCQVCETAGSCRLVVGETIAYRALLYNI